VLYFSPGLSKKGILEDYLLWSLTPSVEVNLQDGYQYYSPANRFGISRWFAGIFNMGITHNVRFVDFFNVSPTLKANSSILGRDYRDPFYVSYLEFKASAYFANSISEPTDGLILDAVYDLAGGFLAGDFDFHKFTASARAYWKPASRLQLAARVQTGMIIPYGTNPGAPINMKFYLGGACTVRGFGSRRLSPRLVECDADGKCTSIPIGGYTMIEANLELRLRLFGNLYLVGFSDGGDVQAAEKTYVMDQWNYTAGPGLRYQSPLGLIRLDVAFRLNDPGVFPKEPMWGIYFRLGEAF
jgi:outer membrane translocation and assembly module TamA